MDVVVNCMNTTPQLLRCDTTVPRNWIKLRLVGTKSNRTGVGARVIVSAENQPGKPMRQIDEVRSGGSYYSQNDLRIHFGLDAATAASVEIQWPSGAKDTLKDLAANNLYVVQEGGKVLKTMPVGTGAKARLATKPAGAE